MFAFVVQVQMVGYGGSGGKAEGDFGRAVAPDRHGWDLLDGGRNREPTRDRQVGQEVQRFDFRRRLPRHWGMRGNWTVSKINFY